MLLQDNAISFKYMYVVNKEVMYTLLHIDSQQVFAGLVLFVAHFAQISPTNQEFDW